MIARNTGFAYKGKQLEREDDRARVERPLCARGQRPARRKPHARQRAAHRRRNAAMIPGQIGSNSLLAYLFDMQDESLRAWRWRRNAELVAAEARRAEQCRIDPMNLDFQGSALVDKGLTRHWRKHELSIRAHRRSRQCRRAGSARADPIEGVYFLRDRSGGLGGGGSEIDQSLVVRSGPRRGHVSIGIVDITRSAPPRASPNASTRWSWIELSPTPMLLSELVRSVWVTPKKPRFTSPRPCASVRAIRRHTSDVYRGRGEESPRPLGEAVAWFRRWIEANRNYPNSDFYLAAALAQLGRLDEARSAVKAGLALNPTFPSPAPGPLDGVERRSDLSGPDRAPSRRPAQGGAAGGMKQV